MRVTFWGVRGSIPAPGPETARYGGNTACLSVEADDGHLIILDAGSGIRSLGMSLAARMPLECSIFISHTHWDHIQGLPFFTPLFVPGNRALIHGAFDPVLMRDIEEILSLQMQYCYFPVRSAELLAEVDYVTLREGQETRAGAATVTPFLMNHTVLNFGYKVTCNGRGLFYTGDHEDYANIYPPDDPFHEDYQLLVDRRREELADFVRGCDVIVADAQYASGEYPSKIGWGHSTPDHGVALAARAGVGRVFFTHHDPTRTDAAADRLLTEILEKHGQSGLSLDLAVEGQSFEV